MNSVIPAAIIAFASAFTGPGVTTVLPAGPRRGWIRRSAWIHVREDLDRKCSILRVGRRSLLIEYSAPSVESFVIGRG